MEKLDCLGWAGGICFKSYGWRIGIRVNDRQALGRLLAQLPPHWEPSEPPFVDYLFSLWLGGQATRGTIRNYHLLYSGIRKAARTLNLDAVFDALESELQLFVAEWARDRVFVHAGVVGWNGRAIVMPGRSLSGKSTLVAALLRAGATYYSDEYAVLDERGHVYPYSRRLSLRQPAGERPKRCSAEELGSHPGIEPQPIRLVAVTKYQAGASWRPRPLTPGRALLELLNNTVPAQRKPENVLSTLQQVASRAENLQGVRGEAQDMVKDLLQELAP